MCHMIIDDSARIASSNFALVMKSATMHHDSISTASIIPIEYLLHENDISKSTYFNCGAGSFTLIT